MIFKKYTKLALLVCSFLFITADIFPGEIMFSEIQIESLSRYTEDRISFQHIQIPNSDQAENDNSIASLLIVRDRQIYLFKDGYDDSKKIKMEAYINELRRQLPIDSWVNKINSKPDYIRISDRRSEKLLNVSEEFVTKNFGNFYISVRDSLITKHVQIFKNLMRDRTESGLVVTRNPISPPAFTEMMEPTKYYTAVSAKSIQDVIYFAEDADGDNVTETLYVKADDGFNWGYKSGPNIIFIKNNKEEDIKQLIGKLCYESTYSTPEEEKAILETFPKDSDIIEAFYLDVKSARPANTTKIDTTQPGGKK